MIAICDCNAFYTGCHKLFIADLWDKGIVALSNNDEIIVSLNPKAKKAGLKRGMARFQELSRMQQHHIQMFSSNYTLYQSISDRVMMIFPEFVERYEINSIDEAFLDLRGYEHLGLTNYCQLIKQAVKRNVGIDISIGVGVNKTLSKIANRFAKSIKRFNGVFVIDTEEKRTECLKKTEIGDVWGIGRELTAKLQEKDIKTAYDFITKMSGKQARKLYSVELERTWCELSGFKCYEIETSSPNKKSISTTRSFAELITDLEGLKQAVATYAGICAADLRKQNTYAVKIRVFVMTNRYRKKDRQYKGVKEYTLPFPSNTGYTLAKYALKALENIYIPGINYKKAGVEILTVTDTLNDDVFESRNLDAKHSKVSPVEDHYSQGFNRKKLSLATMGIGSRKEIALKYGYPSDCSTTDFEQIMLIDCN